MLFQKNNSKFVFLLALIVCAAVVFSFTRLSQAQQSERGFAEKADGDLKRVYRNFNRQVRNDAARQTARAAMREIVGLEEKGGLVSVGVLIRLRGDAAAAHAALEAAGFSLRSRIGDIAAATVPVDELPKLAALDAVEGVSAARFKHATSIKLASRKEIKPAEFKAFNDSANAAIKAPEARSTYNLSGRGVVVGVIDSGIDWKHGDFRKSDGSTRVKFLWDMSDAVNSGPGNLGRVFTEAEINAALRNQGEVGEKDTNNHGTHVAGIAAGNGLGTGNGIPPGTFAGIAPEADLVIVKANRAGSSGFRDDDQIAALQFIAERAAQLNEPFVINMSLGGHGSQHDGTDGVERAIDTLLAAGPGRQVVIAAGNEGANTVHAGGVVAQGDVATVPFTTEKKGVMMAVYSAKDEFSVSVVKPDGTVVGPVAYGKTLETADVSIENADSPAVNNNNSRTISVLVSQTITGAWQLRLKAEKAINGRIDVWDTGDGNALPIAQQAASGAFAVGSPATARNAIAAANFVSKVQFTNVNGGTTTKNDEGQIGAGANSSSQGPTRDGRIKPEIGAPGAYLVSTLSADTTPQPDAGDVANDGGRHVAYTGTSMATPATTGVVALMLQANSNLSSGQIKRILWRTLNNDGFTGVSISRKFGFGKINALAAVKAVVDNVLAAEFVSVSAGSFASDLVATPESIVAGFGANLSGSVEISNTVPLPTVLGGVSVRVTDSAGAARLSPLFFVAPTQINYLIPSGVARGVAQLDVVRDGNVVARGAVNVNTVWPAFFTVNASGSGPGAATLLRVKADGRQIYEPATGAIDLSIQGDRVFLLLFGTGLRGVGELNKVRMTLGGTRLEALYAGPQGDFVGLDQINLLLPRTLIGRGEVDLTLTADGKAANTVRLSFK